jgi:excisionase family DNA binding protein
MQTLTVKDLQSVLKIGRDTAYALVRSKGFPSYKLGGRYYVTQEALERWLKEYEYKSYIL